MCCCLVVGGYIVGAMFGVYTTGIIVACVVVAGCTSGFYPPCYIIACYFCLIFDFWANIFMIAFP